MMLPDSRRLGLRVLAKLLAWSGVAVVAYAFLAFVFLPEGDQVVPQLEVDLSIIAPGEAWFGEWRGQKIVVLHRNEAQLAALAPDDALYDPASRLSLQPSEMRNRHRSREPAWFVAIAHGTDLSCPVRFVPPEEAGDWHGGFIDVCRGSRYDLAGRVLNGQPAKRNLAVPPYRIEPPQRLWLGAK
jgi:ubiquinol-cytochrome c reductase iron-sulfur subunit